MSTLMLSQANTQMLSHASRLSDQDLVARVKLLAHRAREATVLLIAHLAVLDERRLYLAEGCSSLFTYGTQVLHLSEHAAYGRIEAARAARKYPVILERLADGSVNLTTVCLLAPHLTPENHRPLLDEARHRSRREVEELVARLRPQPPVPSTVRRLPSPRSESRTTTIVEKDTQAVAIAEEGTRPAPMADEYSPGVTLTLQAAPPWMLLPGAPPVRAHRSVVEPLAPEQYKVQFTAAAETYEKLKVAQDLLRHKIPDGDVGQVIDQALTVLLKELAKQKHAASGRPRTSSRPPQSEPKHAEQKSNTPSGSRHIPAAVKRAVWARDGGQCAFVAPNGRRCAEQGFLEFHHVVPYATGGEATTENIQLRCRAHNGYEAELFYGRRLAVREAIQPYGEVWDMLAEQAVSVATGPLTMRRTRFEPSCTSLRCP